MQTQKQETLKSKIKKIKLNHFPAFRRTGGRIIFLSDDWKEIHVRLDLNYFTKNYVGSVFGGSIYGALDPIYMVQLVKILGNDYVVWDKSAEIYFIKPIKQRVVAKFIIENTVIEEIKNQIRLKDKETFQFKTALIDDNGKAYAEVVKNIYVANKSYYLNKINGFNK